MKFQENLDESYKQISYSNDYFIDGTNPTIRMNFSHRSYLFIILFLVLTSQSNALSIPPINYHHIHQPSMSFPMNKFDTSTPSVYTYKVYRSHPEYFYNQQLKRERYRRRMIDRLFSQFDEDADGQLSKDELYSLSLRLNIFPRFHYFLKKP